MGVLRISMECLRVDMVVVFMGVLAFLFECG